MAVTYYNTDGAIGIADGGTPRVITVKAGEDISGGFWVRGSGLTGTIGSNASTYTAADIEGWVVANQVGSEVIGLALQKIASGTIGPVAMRGLYLLPAGSDTHIGSVFSGWKVAAGSAGCVWPIGSGTRLGLNFNGVGDADAPVDLSVGRALTSAASASTEFVIVSLNL